MISEVFNMDCMEYMRTIPDKFFDLAIVDPPYGINAPKMVMGGGLLWLLLMEEECLSVMVRLKFLILFL